DDPLQKEKHPVSIAPDRVEVTISLRPLIGLFVMVCHRLATGFTAVTLQQMQTFFAEASIGGNEPSPESAYGAAIDTSLF
ncbi:hypothetical protein ACCY16_22225, partial [Candidatus Pantoea formicae]|uniref:hypothetical protein n=1 Tax=Candidatus Pantoea formicae TaxID=2608355 RepID=UPI003ED8F370